MNNKRLLYQFLFKDISYGLIEIFTITFTTPGCQSLYFSCAVSSLGKVFIATEFTEDWDVLVTCPKFSS